jgi:hypothetical protein
MIVFVAFNIFLIFEEIKNITETPHSAVIYVAELRRISVQILPKMPTFD